MRTPCSISTCMATGRAASTLGPSPIPIPFGGIGVLPNTTQFISRSNQGLSASEVNIEWAFNARPVAGGLDFPGTSTALATALQQYTSFFRSPAQSTTLPTDDHSAGNYELANMEWWNILNGRPQLTPSASPDNHRGLGVRAPACRPLG